MGYVSKMARPSRTGNLVKHLMINRRSKIKEVKEESKPKDPEDIKKLLDMWEKQKENKK